MAKKEKDKVVRRKKVVQDKKPKKQRNQKPAWTWRNWLFILAVIIFVCIVIYVFIFSPLVEVNDIQVNGVEKNKEERIVQVVQDSLEGKVVNGIMRDNYFFVNKDDIKNAVLEDKHIKEVNITKKFPQTIIVDVVEYDILPVWCLGSMQGNCFVVEDGHIKESVTLDSDVIAQNNHFIIVDKGHDSVEIGEQVILSEYLENIKFLGEELKYILSVEIKQPYIILSRGSNEVKFFTDEDWYVLIDMSQNPDEILDAIKLFFAKVELPSRRIDLEYLDMRFPEKIFYKMKEGTKQIEKNTEEETQNTTTKTKSKEKDDKKD
jgi:hypothetical protein